MRYMRHPRPHRRGVTTRISAAAYAKLKGKKKPTGPKRTAGDWLVPRCPFCGKFGNGIYAVVLHGEHADKLAHLACRDDYYRGALERGEVAELDVALRPR